jgi:hypothetical protein
MKYPGITTFRVVRSGGVTLPAIPAGINQDRFLHELLLDLMIVQEISDDPEK